MSAEITPKAAKEADVQRPANDDGTTNSIEVTPGTDQGTDATDARFATTKLTAHEVQSRATRGVAALALRGLSTRLMGLVGNVVLARLLLPRDFGLIALGLTITGLGGFIASGGVASGLIRREETPELEDLRVMMGLNMATTLTVLGVVAAVGPLLGEAGAIAAVMCLSLPIDALRATNSILLERRLNYGPIVRAEIAELMAYNVWSISTVAVGFGVWGVATGFVVRALVGTSMLLYLGPVGLIRPRFGFRRVRPLVVFGLKFQGAGLLSLARDQTVNLLAAAIAGLSALGFWTLTLRLLQVVILLFESLWRVSFPAMTRLLEAGADVKPVLERGLALSALATGLLISPLAGSGPALVAVLFGTRWEITSQVLPFACLNVLIGGPLSACAVGYLYAINRAGLVLSTTALQIVVWIATGIPLIAWLGAPGIGISGLIAALVVDIVVLGGALRRLANVQVTRSLAVPFLSSCVAIGGAYSLSLQLGHNVLSLIASAAAALILYLAPIWLLRRRELIDLIGHLRRGVEQVLPPRGANAT